VWPSSLQQALSIKLKRCQEAALACAKRGAALASWNFPAPCSAPTLPARDTKPSASLAMAHNQEQQRLSSATCSLHVEVTGVTVRPACACWNGMGTGDDATQR
jgi:hypothetical protein